MFQRLAACLTVLLAVFGVVNIFFDNYEGVTIDISSCVRCYQCISQNDKSCADPFSAGTAGNKEVDCATQDSVKYNQLNLYDILPADIFGSVVGAPRYCHKIVTANNTVIRTCLDGVLGDLNHTCQVLQRSSQTATPDKKIKFCSVCDKDKCNGAGSLSFSLPLAVVALLASLIGACKI